MNLVNGALLVGLGLFLAGYVLVARQGFWRGWLWGLVTLVPGPSLAFVLLYWRVARLGFVLGVLGLVMTAGALYGGADRTLERLMGRVGVETEIAIPVPRPQDLDVPNEAQVRRLEEQTGEPLEMLDFDPYALERVQPRPPEGSLQPQPPRERAFRPAGIAALPRLEGERLRVTLEGGEVLEGVLDRADVDSLHLRRAYRGGSATFEYAYGDIRSIEVWAVRGAAPRSAGPAPEGEG
ncbi:hypothetical protein [Ectothiorhodospira mobilis]|uniref:hypothetical protein n=1 Tax=Ectothiorhodospira mobilis TaxID=195064 RepID=UPI001EE9A000|nr:hypothetical protein [Ectothiorhodospira mobilis]MCG5536472.1 hypothetical protein [Ectothiorhodospira mobilis]